MPVPTFYLETSVWGSLAPRQPPDRKRVVQRLLNVFDGVRAVCVISEVVQDEVELAPEAVAATIRQRIEQVRPAVCAVVWDVENLARAYIE